MEENIKEYRGCESCRMGFYLKKWLRRAIPSVVCLIMLWASVRGLGTDAIKARASLIQLDGSSATELVFSGVPEGEESFLCLNGEYNLVTPDARRISCDGVMLRPQVVYVDNWFGVSDSLPTGHCAVSRNLMQSYRLREGDTLSIRKTEEEYVITTLLPAQAGLDEKYAHEGVILLAYDEDLAKKASQSLSFIVDGEQYSDLDAILFKDNLRNFAEFKLFRASLLLFALSVAVVLLCELLLQRKEHKNYGIMAFDGVPPYALCGRIWGDLVVKYFSAEILVCAVCAFLTRAYGDACFRALLPVLIVFFVVLFLIAVFFCRRVFSCRKKKKLL
jgi:hypothetical protein